MAELAELGFTGLDKIADRYYDKAYDKVPNPKRAYQNRRRNGGRRSKSVDQGRGDMAPYNGNNQGYNNNNNNNNNNYDPNYQGNGYQNNGYQGNGYQYQGNRGYDNTRGDPRGRYQGHNYNNGYQRDAYGPGEYSGSDEEREMGYEEDYPRSRRNNDDRYSNAPSGNDREVVSSRSRGKTSEYGGDRRDRWERTDDRKRDRSDHRSPTGTNIGASVVGALAGGLLGNEMGHGDVLGLVSGAIIGGLGAHKLENQYEKKKNSRLQQAWEEGPGGKRDRHHRRRRSR